MLLGRIPIPFTSEHPESLDEPGSGVPRIDDVVDVAPRGRRVGMSELAGVLGNEPISGCRRILGPGDLVLEEDLDGTFGPITAISADGHARLTSPRMCFELMTS